MALRGGWPGLLALSLAVPLAPAGGPAATSTGQTFAVGGVSTSVQPTQEPQGSSDPSGDQLDFGPDSTEELELSPEWQASAMAVATGEPVEIVSQRTETTQAWAMPDGTFEAKVHVAPERFLRNGE